MKKAQNIARLHIATPEALRQAVQEAASMRMQSANSYVRQALREALRRDRAKMKRENEVAA